MKLPTMSIAVGGTLFESYDIANTDGDASRFGASWLAQIFKANTGHTLDEIVLWLWRTGTIGQITVSIQALSGGDPDGTDLTSISFDGMLLGTSVVKVIMNVPPAVLSVGVSYAIVVRLAGGDASNKFHWAVDGSSPTYTDGNQETSPDSGATWTAVTTVDHCFEERGFV